jgi:hypothetical protein
MSFVDRRDFPWFANALRKDPGNPKQILNCDDGKVTTDLLGRVFCDIRLRSEE